MSKIVRWQDRETLAELLELCRAFFEEYESLHEEFFDLDALTDAAISGRFEASIDSDNSATFVALDNRRLVGYALLAVREQAPFYKIKRVGSIAGLYVLPEYRRQGRAVGLMNACRDFFAEQNVKYYTLFTSVNNNGAIKLYRRLGLEELHATFLGRSR